MVNQPYEIDNTVVTQDRLEVLLSNSSDSIELLSTMLKNAKKRQFVQEHHTKAITQISSGKKSGKWKTYVGDPRKEVLRNTEKELIDYLFDYYKNQNRHEPTYADVFEELMDYKLNVLNRDEVTIRDYRCRHNRFASNQIYKCKIIDITETMILHWLKECVQSKTPKIGALKRLIQQASAVFDFAIQKKYCSTNPVRAINPECFYKDCDHSAKTGEEKEFSSEEILKLRTDCENHLDNPRSLMMLLAMETGARAGELSAIQWSDIKDEYIFFHRQQKLDDTKKGQRKYWEVGYTKDERLRPHGGRQYPITASIAKILDLAKQLPGTSEYVFHDKDGREIKKDSYELYLRRKCRSMGINITNNHAFRMALNSRFIELGLDSSIRATLLGHTVQTNERHYSLTDRRRISHVKSLLECR